jgi:hypothetical protein
MNDPEDDDYDPDYCPKTSNFERMLDLADYLRDCAKDDRICPPEPSPEEIAADARDAAEDAAELNRETQP